MNVWLNCYHLARVVTRRKDFIMTAFTIRNFKLYFRDKAGVLFSLLSVVIIIVLYAVFLGDVWLNDSMKNLPDTDVLMNTWLVSGLLAVTSVTTTMGAFSTMIDDKIKKINKDFYSSPLKRAHITGGYLFSTFLVGVIMMIATLIAAQIYLVAKGGAFFSLAALVKIFCLILFSTLANTSMVCFIVSFFKTHSAFSAASTILGTLIGFLTGIYLPIGSLSEGVQTVIKFFPPSHSAALFKQVIMETAMEHSFEGIPVQYLDEFKEYMGVTFRIGDYVITPLISIIVLIVTSVIFYGLALFNMSRKSK